MPYKRAAKWVLASILILLSIFYNHTPAYAKQEASYSISEYTSEITLNSDGSVYFEDTATYRLLSESVEFIKAIPMAYSSKADGIEVFRLQSAGDAEANPQLIQLQQADQPDSADGETYTYQLANAEEDIYHITIPFKGRKREEVTFVYRYKMMDTVFLYNDTAVFFWQSFMPDMEMNVENVQIQISLPEAVSPEKWSGYARGAVYTQKEILEDGVFRISADRVRKGEYLESILLLPNSLFPDGRKIIDNYAEQDIASDMASWEDQASRTRREEELRFYGGWATGLLAVLLCIGTVLLLYLKTRTDQNDLDQQENRNGIPDAAISPAELGVLIKGGKAGARELFATVLSLIRSRFLELQHREEGEGFFILREDIPRDRLKPHEEYVLNWVASDLSHGQEVPLTDVNQVLTTYGRSHKNKISTWESLVYQRTRRMDFHENISKLKIWAMGTVLVSLLAAILAWVIMDNQWAGLLAGLFALALAVYVIPLKKTSRSGRTFQANWLKYRDELLTKLSDEQNKLPLNKWEEELIYAVPLGTAEEILNELPQMYNESEFEDGNLTILYKDNVPWLSHMLESTK
ncbi:MAG: DUF2207 family protein [Caldicoprobacterales bacterium]|jgi:hypothetical protein